MCCVASPPRRSPPRGRIADSKSYRKRVAAISGWRERREGGRSRAPRAPPRWPRSRNRLLTCR
eukprot:scaffold10136_cov126-Isochrysis_galbana.AAC.4